MQITRCILKAEEAFAPPIAQEMMPTYRINSPKVVAETIDNESVVINLDRGTYYSIRETGSQIWEALRIGVSSEYLVAECERTASSPEAAEQTNTFIGRLVEEELLVVDNEPAAQTVGSFALAGAFNVPTLDKYSDMEALLLLDPIHDVDEAGWPLPA